VRRLRWRALAIAAALALQGAVPLTHPSAAIDPVLAASIRTLVAKDLRIASIAYRLQTAAIDLCPARTRLPGLIVQDASQYRADLRPAMAMLYKLEDRPAVTGVVPDSAGDRAGIRVGDAILAVNGQSLGDASAPPARRTSDRFDSIADSLDTAFRNGPVTLLLRRAGAPLTLVIVGAPACASEIQLDLSSRRNAEADGKRITVSQGLVDFAGSDDELAYLIGHELSHNLLGHRALLDASKTSRSGLFAGVGANAARIRATEEQADYYGLYVAALAGYDLRAGANFWRRWGREFPLGTLLRDRSHPANADRVAELDREADEIEAKRRSGVKLMPIYEAFIQGAPSHP
jgi:hypothetical protein